LTLIVNTNSGAIRAQSALATSMKGLQTAMERLSSGKKINSAADDAAGFAIAERMTSQIKGLGMAVKNINDAKSMLDTVETRYVGQSSLLQRARELAVQAGNDTNSPTDKSFLQSEALTLVAEIQRISSQTTFNGEAIANTNTFQIGSEAGQTIESTNINYSGFSGSIVGVSSQSYAAGASIIEFVGRSSTGPFVHGDMIIVGLENSQTFYHISAPSSVVNNADGTWTQTITLDQNLASDIDPYSTIIAAVAQFDHSVPEGQNGFILGGRGSLMRMDFVNDAAGAITTIDSVRHFISSSRASLGATQNRLDYTASNLMTVSDFTTAARSRIEDADFAAESARLAKEQVLQQTGVAMLSQANASSQLAISLIK
jgi:flagellin